LFLGGAWAVGQVGMEEPYGIPRQLLVRVTGTTVRRVQVPGPAGGSLEDVAATSAANAWAAGYSARDGPLIVHWNGTAWQRAPLPKSLRTGQFTGLASTSRTNAWAVMDPWQWGRAWIVHWNGKRWGDVVNPAIGVSYQLYDVTTSSATDAWAVGQTGSSRAVILHWNGLRWTCALSPKMHGFSSRRLLAVSASSADNACAVGGSDTETLALHWNGHSWKQVMTRQPGLVNILVDFAFIPPSRRAWAIDSTDTGSLVLQWNGTAWH